MSDTQRVLILGSGFAGTYAYLEFLKKAKSRRDLEIVMVSQDDSFLFIPLLHEVATGNLPPTSISQPIMSLPQARLDDYIRARVTGIDFDSQAVSIELGNNGKSSDTLSYDYLVIATGSETTHHGVPGAKEHTFPLKNLEDARAIKNHILDVFEQAQCHETGEDLGGLLTFVIAGGGPTGVEMAGELSDFIYRELSAVYPDLARAARIILTDGSTRLLKELDMWFSEEVREILERKNVLLCLGEFITEVRPDGLIIGESFIQSRTVIWAAGVTGSKLNIDHLKPVEIEQKSNRIKVGPTLRLSSYPNVFVAGDQAFVIDKETEQPYTMRAQFAVRQGVCVARNILAHIDGKPLADFFWNDMGIILSLGDKDALAKMIGMRLSGPIAWIAYRAAYLAKMYGWKTKIRTFVEWMLNLWAPRDISKI